MIPSWLIRTLAGGKYRFIIESSYYTTMGKCFSLTLLCLLGAAVSPANSAPGRKTSVVRPDVRTGRLVRSVVVAPRVVAAKPVSSTDLKRPVERPAPATFHEAVEHVAWRNALPVQLVHSVVKVESNYNPLAVSPKGAMGLMQLIPATARRFGVSNPFNPMENLNGGARYLRYLLDLYGEDNLHLALAAYNAGEGAVARYGGVPPYAETRNYLVRIRRDLERARKRGAVAVDAATAGSRHETVEVKPAVVQNHIYEVREPDGRVRYVSR
jgi:hypothetical protein